MHNQQPSPAASSAGSPTALFPVGSAVRIEHAKPSGRVITMRGRVQIVDEQELADAMDSGAISAELGATATQIASRVAKLVAAGGDWRTADAEFRSNLGQSKTPGHVRARKTPGHLRPPETPGGAPHPVEVDPEVVDRPTGEKRGVPSWLLKPGG